MSKDKQLKEAQNKAKKEQEKKMKQLEKIYNECYKKFIGLTVNEANLVLKALHDGINQTKI